MAACVRACVRRVVARARAFVPDLPLPPLVSYSGGSSACSPECSIRPAPKFSTPRIRGEGRRGEGNVGGIHHPSASLDRETSSTPLPLRHTIGDPWKPVARAR